MGFDRRTSFLTRFVKSGLQPGYRICPRFMPDSTGPAADESTGPPSLPTLQKSCPQGPPSLQAEAIRSAHDPFADLRAV